MNKKRYLLFIFTGSLIVTLAIVAVGVYGKKDHNSNLNLYYYVLVCLLALYLMSKKLWIVSRIVFLSGSNLFFLPSLNGPQIITLYSAILIVFAHNFFSSKKYRYLAWMFNGLTLIITLVVTGIINSNYFYSFNVDSELLITLMALTFISTTVGFYGRVNNQAFNKIRKIKKHQVIETNRLKEELDRFVYRVSHDIRGPISTIQGLISLTRFSDSPKELHLLIGQIDKSVESLKKFTMDVLDYSKNDRMNLCQQSILLKELVEEVREELVNSNYNFDSEIIYLNFDYSLSFYGDVSRLKIVLSNLIGNALKFRDSRKDLSCIKVDAKISDDYFTITISDNGIGILPERLAKVFDMFYRGNETSKGAGLGLYIVKEAIKNMKGSMSIASQQNEGTIVKIVLPSNIELEQNPTTLNSQLIEVYSM